MAGRSAASATSTRLDHAASHRVAPSPAVPHHTTPRPTLSTALPSPSRGSQAELVLGFNSVLDDQGADQAAVRPQLGHVLVALWVHVAG